MGKTEGTAVLQLLNQLGDHGHFTTETKLSNKSDHVWFGIKFIALVDLGYRAVSNTQYLKDNCLKFRLFLKVNIL